MSIFKCATVAAAVALIAACSTDTTAPVGGTLAGLKEAASHDSSVGVVGPGQTGPGSVHGTVLGQAPAGSGNDTLNTSPRVANVAVTIYQQTHGIEGEIEPGAQVGAVTTDASGQWQTPTIPAGDYVVTFVPPAGSVYAGVYVTGHISAVSVNYQWWIVVPKK